MYKHIVMYKDYMQTKVTVIYNSVMHVEKGIMLYIVLSTNKENVDGPIV